MNEEKSIKLDKKDRKILYELDKNARQPLSRIAKKIRISRQAIQHRYDRIVNSGLIKAFTTVIDFGKLGYLNYEVWIRLKNLDGKKRENFEREIIENKRINWSGVCGGKFDYVIDILAQNPVDFYDVINEILERHPDFVQEYKITITREMINYSRILFGARENKREVRSYSKGNQTNIRLKNTDLKILEILSDDSRTSIIKMAEMINVSPNTIKSSIRWLERNKVLNGYKIILQPKLLKLEHYEILISMQPISDRKRKELDMFCELNEDIIYLIKTVGEWDLNIVVETTNTNKVYDLLNEARKRFGDTIKNYEIVPIITVLKADYFTDPYKN